VAGQTFWLGLALSHQPHWHTYWRNPGDSGLPTQLRWTLPAGLTAQDTLWPVPKKIAIGSLTNYGYENQTLLVVPIRVAGDFKTSTPITVQVMAQWLVCRQECIPQDGTLTLTMPTQGGTATHGAAFEAALQAQPNTLSSAQRATATLSEQGTRLTLQVPGLPSAWRGQRLQLFPITPEVVVNSASLTAPKWQGDVWTAQLPVSPDRMDSPTQLQWLLALDDDPAKASPPFEVHTSLQGAWPAPRNAAVPAALTQALQSNAQGTTQTPISNAAATLAPARIATTLWLGALLGAFLGGLLLNLMPCVFPVLAIKVIGFAQPGHTRTEHRSAGWAYTAGVVLSFSLLGGLMLALRAGGSQLGWGFQLQSPAVVAGLALLFTLLGLNLSGWFEFGQFVPSRLAAVQHRHPAVDAAWSGVLAVVVASPCTAPFMGASLGLAIGLPAWQALPIFMAMGLGLALPYLAASLWPAVARALPRPGPWMEVLRRVLAFPMFATVIWLLWVLGQQTGIDGAMSVLSLLWAVSFSVWAWRVSGRARWWLVALGAGLSLWLGSLVLDTLRLPSPQTAEASAEPTAHSPWQVWSPAALQAHLDAGRSVFVDFTAAWCVTCQYNKKTTLSDPGLLQTFQSRNTALLRADWTRQDPTITQALNALGRSGVPVYVVYAPGQAPRVLSELPSVAEIKEALRQ
jgi:thiol:disulfide interchange protein DsbD